MELPTNTYRVEKMSLYANDLFTIDNDSYVVIPKEGSFEDLTYDIILNKEK